jgi:prevent-host-death family protein
MQTQTVTIREAQTRWSDLMARAEAGEEIVLTRYGRPVAKLIRLQPAPVIRADATPRRPGAWKGKIHIAPDFDELPEEIAVAFGVKTAIE